MKKSIITCLCIFIIVLFSGCGSILPTLSYEQEEKIVDYTASIVIEHMKNYNSKLVDLSKYENIESEPQEETGMDPVEEKDTIDITEPIDESRTLTDILGIFDCEVMYNGYHICNTYPDESNDDICFTLDAKDNKKLVVLEFTLTNQSVNEQKFNLFESGTKYTICFNDNTSKKVLSTMLLDDMSSYIGTLGSNESINLVLITEIDEAFADNILTIQLLASSANGDTTIHLQ